MRAFRAATLGIVLAVGLLLVPPNSTATRPDVKVGVLAPEFDLASLPANLHAERISASDVTPGKLKHYDGLLLDASSLQSLLSDASSKHALKQFLKSNRILAVEGDSAAFDALSASGLPKGGDTPIGNDGQALPVNGRLSVAYRAASGGWDVLSSEFGNANEFHGKAARELARWTNDLPDFQPQAGNNLQAEAADNANWNYYASSSYSYTWNPYGRIGYTADFNYALSDGTTAYKWWDVVMRQTVDPGIDLYGGSNQWHTHMAWLTSNVPYYNASFNLVDWSPYTSVDSTTGTMNTGGDFGMTSGTDGAVQTSKLSNGYSISYSYVTQASSASSDQLYVRHDFNYGSGPAAGAWTNSPGFSVRTPESSCLKIPWTNKAQWREYHDTGSDSYYTTWINSWREVC